MNSVDSAQTSGANDVGNNDTEVIPTYSEAFPPLAGDHENVPTTSSENQWLNPKVQRIRSTVVTQIFHIPMEERAFKQSEFGQSQKDQSKVCIDIMRITDTMIEMSTCRDGSLSLLVSGKAENVLKARREIFNKLQTQACVTVNIPKEHHRVILGKAGSRLQKLELETATKINIPRSEKQSTEITIVGTQEGIHRARQEIQMISDEQAKLAMERLPIEKMYHPFINGPRNEFASKLSKVCRIFIFKITYVKKAMILKAYNFSFLIKQEHGVRIHIPPPSVQKDEVVVSGERDGVAAAVNKIMMVYQQKSRNCKTISVEINKSQHKYIIGPRGQTLQDILAEADVSVELPPTDSLSETVVLRGEPGKLGQGLTIVYAKANSVVIREVSAAAWLHRFIIGKKGANIRAITSNLPRVNVEFQDEGNKIVIEGPPEEADPAQQQLELQVKELKARMDFAEVHIDPKFHKNIIGKGGQSINKLRDQYNVNIQIPTDTDKSSLIRIEGDPEGVKEAKKELEQMGQRLENEKSKDVLIEHRFHRNIIGQKGEKVKAIRDLFPKVNISFPDAKKKSDVVNLRGPKNDVEKCYKYLKQLNDDMVEKNYCIDVPIFKQYHKNIIGKGGANIRKIREETNTQIELPKEDSDNEVIVITGKKADCEKARKLIRAIEREQANIVEESVTINPQLHNQLIGAKGRLVRSLMDDYGGNVQIHFPMGSSGSDKVTIRGPKEEVEKAKDQLMQIAKQKELSSYTKELKCKAELHRFLIGRGGTTIKKVRDETGARIMFPASNDTDKETITVMGKQADVDTACKILEERIKSMENIVEIEMEIEQKHHKYFVARRGAVLRDIADEFGGVAVSFPRIGDESSTVRIKGPSECVEGAKSKLAELVDDLDNQVTIECLVDEQYHRTVIGQKGRNIQGVTSQYNVQVKFPSRNNAPANGDKGEVVENGTNEEENKDLILITGHKDRCQKAKEAILALVPISEQVDVPYKFHRYIIGQKGLGVRKLMEDYDITISIPPADQNSNFITITGVSSKLEAAKEGLMERVKVIEGEEEDRVLRGFTLTVDVPNQYHPQIIGRRGVTVTDIRNKHSVNIQFPDRDDEKKDQIRIIGYEKNTESARDAVMKIVNELESHISQDIHIDRKVHPRLIGTKGRAIKKIMEDFGVDIRFPKDEDIVTVTGALEKVDECVEHILNLEEEYMQDIAEQEETKRYSHSTYQGNEKSSRSTNKAPFVVRDAPWHQPGSVDTNNLEEFPSLGGPSSGNKSSSAAPAWGRRY
uniref:vigilin isoform X2 n=1 Tax=Ciona intestinalis TaxID=7719 RepID=UPI000EF4BE3E|nr:vigilin isoform X2 [Ciona intestinalis]|eukprot:XP_026691860.1 vigilin isoform X2 [Ciona intestinalis]